LEKVAPKKKKIPAKDDSHKNVNLTLGNIKNAEVTPQKQENN
jgi:hypothetical protein